MDREVLLTQEQAQNSFIFFSLQKKRGLHVSFWPFLKYLPKSFKGCPKCSLLNGIGCLFLKSHSFSNTFLREALLSKSKAFFNIAHPFFKLFFLQKNGNTNESFFSFLKTWLFNLLCTIAYKILTNIFS